MKLETGVERGRAIERGVVIRLVVQRQGVHLDGFARDTHLVRLLCLQSLIAGREIRDDVRSPLLARLVGPTIAQRKLDAVQRRVWHHYRVGSQCDSRAVAALGGPRKTALYRRD